MIEKGLYLDFPNELLKECLFFDSLFFDDLYRQQKTCLLVSELTRTYLAVYTLLNLPSPISLPSLKSETASNFFGVSVAVVDTVSLKSFRLIYRHSCLHFYVFSLSLLVFSGDLTC